MTTSIVKYSNAIRVETDDMDLVNRIQCNFIVSDISIPKILPSYRNVLLRSDHNNLKQVEKFVWENNRDFPKSNNQNVMFWLLVVLFIAIVVLVMCYGGM